MQCGLGGVEHVRHATYDETVLEWDMCLFMRTLPVRVSDGQQTITVKTTECDLLYRCVHQDAHPPQAMGPSALSVCAP